MAAEFLSPAFTDFEESAELDLPEVLALQGLVMGQVRRLAIERGRKMYVRGDPRTHAYCVLQSCGPDLESGEKDYYLGVRVRRIGFRAWSMGVSFLENEMTLARRNENERTLYQFRWNNQVALGRKVERLAIGMHHQDDRPASDFLVLEGSDSTLVQAVFPLQVSELDIIANRALEVAVAATPRAA